MPDGHNLLEAHLIANDSTACIVIHSTEQHDPSLVIALGLVCGALGHLHVKWVSRVEVTMGRKRHILCLSADSFICANQWLGAHGALDSQGMLMLGVVLGKFGLVRSRAIFAGPETGQSGP